jgi:hypothetical protein
LLNREWTAAFVLNVDPACGISFTDAFGNQLAPYKVIMLDSGSDICAMTRRQAILLGVTCVQVHMHIIAFGDNRCPVNQMATNVPTTLFNGTPEEIQLGMDYLVMPDTDQFQFLFGQPFLAHYRICGMVSTYLDSLLVFPDLGYQPREYTRAHGLGRMLEIPVTCHRTSAQLRVYNGRVPAETGGGVSEDIAFTTGPAKFPRCTVTDLPNVHPCIPTGPNPTVSTDTAGHGDTKATEAAAEHEEIWSSTKKRHHLQAAGLGSASC